MREDRILNDFDRRAVVSLSKKYNVISMVYCDKQPRNNSAYILFFELHGFILSKSVYYRDFIDSKERRISLLLESIDHGFGYLFKDPDNHFLTIDRPIDSDYINSVAYVINSQIEKTYYHLVDTDLISENPNVDFELLTVFSEELLQSGLGPREVFRTLYKKLGMLEDSVVKKIESL